MALMQVSGGGVVAGLPVPSIWIPGAPVYEALIDAESRHHKAARIAEKAYGAGFTTIDPGGAAAFAQIFVPASSRSIRVSAIHIITQTAASRIITVQTGSAIATGGTAMTPASTVAGSSLSATALNAQYGAPLTAVGTMYTYGYFFVEASNAKTFIPMAPIKVIPGTNILLLASAAGNLAGGFEFYFDD